MAFSMNQDKMLSLNKFDEDMSDTFRSSDCCSSNDFVARWHSQFGGKDNSTSDTDDSTLDKDNSTRSDTDDSTLDKDNSTRSDMDDSTLDKDDSLGNDDSYDEPPWTTPIMPVQTSTPKTTKAPKIKRKTKSNVKNTSALTLHVKLATMSPRCYEQAQKLMDLYQAGQLDRARHNNTVLLVIHATYFDFLYTYNVMEQEDEKDEEDLKKATNALKRVKEELAATEKEKRELEKEITELRR
ncbi:Hypothetical predicted protein, partial [Paramuricea clavata]